MDADVARRAGPRYSVERELRNLWVELLGHREFGIHDNLFDVGGDSVTAIRLLGHIKEQFGFDLRLDALFSAPTIGGIAILLRGDATGSGSSMVAMNPVGTRRPLFCFHPMGGSVARYFALAKALGSDQPVYALQSLGLTGAERAQDCIPEMARRYIDEIAAVQPEGPYLLFGYSMGGLVAYEVAQQLWERDRSPATVMLADTSARVIDSAEGESTIHAVANFAMKLDIDVTEFAGLPAEQAVDLLYKQGIEHGIFDWAFPMEWLTNVYATVDGNLKAIAAYEIKPWAGRMVLFHGGTAETGEDLGWAPFATRLTTHYLGLGHFVTMEEKGMRRVAALLQQHELDQPA